MRLSQNTAVRLEQSIRLSPQMLQSIKLMELPLIELRERINEELEKNPALEVVNDKAQVPISQFELKKKNGDAHCSAGKNQQFIEGALSRAETLQEHLLFQFRLQSLSAGVQRAGELIIQNLSGDGFNEEELPLLLKNESKADADTALSIVQSLDPQGCATRDYIESLSVQARLRFGSRAAKIESLFPHLEALERGKITLVSRALKQKEEVITALFECIKMLSPFPGRQFAEGAEECARFVVPDIRIFRVDGEFKLVLNNETIPVLGLSPFFLENENSAISSERDFIRENLKEARWFLNAINRRNHTLFRVTRALIHFQRDFFERGPRYLVPLTLSDVAAELNIHETTVSRAANGKFIETEWGIYEIRRFFTNAINRNDSKDSKRFSKAGVQEIIREIIETENHSLSDSEIVQLLDKRGIKLARRTVAKYRSQLGLDASYHR